MDAGGCYRIHQLSGMEWMDREQWLYQHMLLEASSQPLPWDLAPQDLCFLLACPTRWNKAWAVRKLKWGTCAEYCSRSPTENGWLHNELSQHSVRIRCHKITGIIVKLKLFIGYCMA
jgi:hypothetical protein